MIIKGSIYPKDITITDKYTPNNRMQNIWSKTNKIERTDNSNRCVVGHISIQIWIIDRKLCRKSRIQKAWTTLLANLTQLTSSKYSPLSNSRIYNVFKCTENSLQCRPYTKP